MFLAQRPQRIDAGEARTRGPSVSSQAFYHWATALPASVQEVRVIFKWNNLQSLGKVLLHFKNMNFVYPMFHFLN